MVLPLGRLVTISAKVDEELKRKAKELGINVSALVRRALEEESRKVELQNAVKKLRKELEKSPKLPKGTVARIIREVREQRVRVKQL